MQQDTFNENPIKCSSSDYNYFDKTATLNNRN